MASRIALDLILTGYAWLVGLYDEIWQASPCFGRVAARIIKECRGINRLSCDITGIPSGTIEWERRGVEWANFG